MIPNSDVPIFESDHEICISMESHTYNIIDIRPKLLHTINWVTTLSNLIDGNVLLGSSDCHNLLILVKLYGIHSSLLLSAHNNFDAGEVDNHKLLCSWAGRYYSMPLI